MALRDMVPWRKQAPANPADYFASFREQMDRLLSDFWTDFPGTSLAPRFESKLGTFMPQVEVSEDKEKVKVTAELPGLSENDVQLTLAANGEQLVIKGEKKLEEERKEESFYRSERIYGSFQRVLALPARVDPEKVNATFKDGVLTVNLVKRPEAESGSRQIRIGK
ncbi:MAG TPA: Hsp20/alpha crystallin family protein [Haliangium sp.]|nr:Hsp20/alpha crystallin family protein [Haliangium sp.]